MRLRTWGYSAILAVLVATSGACVGGSKGLSDDDKARLKPYVLDSAPADIPHKVDINFENRVHVIGYKLDPETARPGADVKITYWWRCDDTVDDGWQLFTHLHDAASDKSDNLDWNGPLRENRNNKQILGPDRWEKGKVYVDEQTYKMPDWVKGPELSVMVGVWKGDARLRIVAGPNDGDNRALVGKIKTGIMPTSPMEQHSDIPALTVTKLAANEKIAVDGKLDEKAWGGATGTGPFVDVGTGKPNTSFPVNGSAKVLWDDQSLYVGFEVSDPDILGYFTDAKSQENAWTTTGQPKLWTKDTVEIMIDPDPSGDNKDYYELQINPQNKQFHTQYDTYNAPKTEPNGPFGHEDWDPKLKSAVIVRGTLDKGEDKDDGYTVEIAIPWTAFTKGAGSTRDSGAPQALPRPGDTWRMNFYAMKQNSGVAWSPILGQGNFHKASRFGRVTWVTPGMAPPDAGAEAGVGAADGGAATMAHADGGAALGPFRPRLPIRMKGQMGAPPSPPPPSP